MSTHNEHRLPSEHRLPNDPPDPIERVQRHPLPEEVMDLVEAYDDVVGDRDRFLWKWAHHLFPKFTLSTVPRECVEDLQDAKLLGLIYVSVLDDIAEKHGDRATFEEAAKIPFEHQSVNYERSDVDRDALEFATTVWERFAPTLTGAPRSDEFADIVRFDLKQMLNAMEYSCLVNEHLDVLTESELQTYDAHNMMVFGFADVDLVHSPTFVRTELSTLRRVIDHAQRMVRIGNWITTWERELSEGDFTSGIVVHAVENDVVTLTALRSIQENETEIDVEELIETIDDHAIEEVFLHQWHEELAAARALSDGIASVDIEEYLDGVEAVMEYHLASRGLK